MLLAALLFACGGAAPEAVEAPEAPPPAAAPAAPEPDPVAEAAPAPAEAPPEPAADGGWTPATPTAKAVAKAWDALLASGCDPAKPPVAVWTPVEARLLAAVPVLRQGASTEGKAAVRALGGTVGEGALAGDARDCVQWLMERERELVNAAPRVWKPDVVDRLVEGEVFRPLNIWGGGAETNPYEHGELTPEGPLGGPRLRFALPGCEGHDCGGYEIDCPPEGPCQAMAAG